MVRIGSQTAAGHLPATGDTIYRAFQVRRAPRDDGRIAETTIVDPALFAQFGLPETIEV